MLAINMDGFQFWSNWKSRADSQDWMGKPLEKFTKERVGIEKGREMASVKRLEITRFPTWSMGALVGNIWWQNIIRGNSTDRIHTDVIVLFPRVCSFCERSDIEVTDLELLTTSPCAPLEKGHLRGSPSHQASWHTWQCPPLKGHQEEEGLLSHCHTPAASGMSTHSENNHTNAIWWFIPSPLFPQRVGVDAKLLIWSLDSWHPEGEFAFKKVGMNLRQFSVITQDGNWAGPNINKNKHRVCKGHGIPSPGCLLA